MALEMGKKILEDDGALQQHIILLAHTNNEPIKGQTKLQKIMFMLSKQIDAIREQTGYDSDNYGPYSKIVEKECNYLEQIGILSIDNRNIAITESGRSIYDKINERVDKNTRHFFIEYKKLLNDLTDEELSAFIYSAYPDMADESVEYKKLKPHMEDHIFSLIKKEKITAQRAAELLGKPQNYVIEIMKEKNICVLR